MSTLMQWGNSEGIQGRCDAKCHNTAEPVCACMCGGRFHGAAGKPGGLDHAIEKFWDEVVEKAKKKAEKEGLILETRGPQLDLF